MFSRLPHFHLRFLMCLWRLFIAIPAPSRLVRYQFRYQFFDDPLDLCLLETNLKIDGVTLHSLRHTHASQLIAAGMDVLTISCRLGHSKPTITLSTYGHLF